MEVWRVEPTASFDLGRPDPPPQYR
jgi:hypothetical protein